MSTRSLVLDANILIRAVLGNKVRTLITTYSESIDFFTPDVCMADAKKYLPILLEVIMSPFNAIVCSFLKKAERLDVY
jgi:PIN domain